MLDTLRSDAKASRQFLLLAHLYSRTDATSLALLRRKLVSPKLSAAQVMRQWPLPLFRENKLFVAQVTVGAGMAVSAVTATALAANDDRVSAAVSEHISYFGDKLSAYVPLLGTHPRLTGKATPLGLTPLC